MHRWNYRIVELKSWIRLTAQQNQTWPARSKHSGSGNWRIGSARKKNITSADGVGRRERERGEGMFIGVTSPHLFSLYLFTSLDREPVLSCFPAHNLSAWNAFLWTKRQKKEERGLHPAILNELAWSIKGLLYVRKITQRLREQSGQDTM